MSTSSDDPAGPAADLDRHLDAAYATIMAALVERGETLHFTDVAASLGVAVEDGRTLVHRLMELTPGWTHPGTDWIASFPPFNAQPTQYRISIDGQHGWFGQ